MTWNEGSYKWLFEAPYDPEYKYYLFMATVQKWDDMLQKKVLFPEVILLPQIKKELEVLIQEIESIKNEGGNESIPENLEKWFLEGDIEEHILEGYKLFMRFVLEKVTHYARAFQELRQEIEEHLVVEEVGILPLHKREGFLILEEPEKGEKVYQIFYYQLGMIQWYGVPTYQAFWMGQKRGSHFSKWWTEGSQLIKHYELRHSIPPAILYSQCDLENIPVERTRLPLIMSRYWEKLHKKPVF